MKKATILERKGNNVLIEKENCDIACRDTYMIICALNYQDYLGMALYDSKIEFSVSSEVSQEVKDDLLQIARKYFNT